MGAHENRFVIAGVLEQVPPACHWVGEQARQAGLDDRAVYHCQLAVDEACTNIIEHGFDLDGADHQITIVCYTEPHQFSIEIIDDSEAFDPFSLPDPDPSMTLEQRGKGGWGIYFIKKLMDHVSHNRVGDYNHLFMSKRIGASHP